MSNRFARAPIWIRGLAMAVCALVFAAAGPAATAVPGSTAAPKALRPRASIPGSGCTVFPSDNVWNSDISKLPVNSKSGTWLRTMNSDSTLLHPDFGKSPYGLPFAVVDNGHPTVGIRFTYASQSDPGPYPFGPDIPLEGGSDRHALIVNKDTCTLYELFAAHWHHGDPYAGSGAIFDLGSNVLRADTWTSADAAGLPILPGLVRYDEVAAGVIDHAIRFTADLTDCHHIWPARHDAGTCNSNYPPMGARFRLKAGFSLQGFSGKAKVILRAMKHYGLILADNGSNWFFQGTEDQLWTNRLLDQLKTVPASAFVAVDESACRVDPDSAEANCP
jgi:hypothetical protein